MNNTPASNRTGLWVSESKNGRKYMRGSMKIGDSEYLIKIFKNEKKEKPSQPDYNMLYELKEEKQEPTPEVNENKSVELTDSDVDELMNTDEINEDELDLPF